MSPHLARSGKLIHCGREARSRRARGVSVGQPRRERRPQVGGGEGGTCSWPPRGFAAELPATLQSQPAISSAAGAPSNRGSQLPRREGPPPPLPGACQACTPALPPPLLAYHSALPHLSRPLPVPSAGTACPSLSPLPSLCRSFKRPSLTTCAKAPRPPLLSPLTSSSLLPSTCLP